MANENIPEQEYDDFNTPTPGESLTAETKAWPWDSPPLYPSFEEAIDANGKKCVSSSACYWRASRSKKYET